MVLPSYIVGFSIEMLAVFLCWMVLRASPQLYAVGPDGFKRKTIPVALFPIIYRIFEPFLRSFLVDV
jgi:hypothetical protein